MGNYPGGMTRRLAITIALYIERFGVWPVEARLSPLALWWIARSLDETHFTALAERLKLRVTKHSLMAVGGPPGHQIYTQEVHPNWETVDRVERELGHDLASWIHDDPELIHSLLIGEFGDEPRFHRFFIAELLAWTDLARTLGIWHFNARPVVSQSPLDGLFDFRLDAPKGPPDYLDIWLRRRPKARYEAQADTASTSRHIYVLLDGTRPDWPEADGTIWIMRSDLVAAVASTASSLAGDALGDLARAYSARLVMGAPLTQTDEDLTV
jgi:hypothetical protein